MRVVCFKVVTRLKSRRTTPPNRTSSEPREPEKILSLTPRVARCPTSHATRLKSFSIRRHYRYVVIRAE